MKESEVCAICLEDNTFSTNVHLECGHVYHCDCIIKYFYIAVEEVYKKKTSYSEIRVDFFFLMSSFKCPMCRSYIDRRHVRNIVQNRRETLRNVRKSCYIELKKRQLRYIFLCLRKQFSKTKELEDEICELKEDVNLMTCIWQTHNKKFKTTNELYNMLEVYNQI
jgi:hypothetical protein